MPKLCHPSEIRKDLRPHLLTLGNVVSLPSHLSHACHVPSHTADAALFEEPTLSRESAAGTPTTAGATGPGPGPATAIPAQAKHQQSRHRGPYDAADVLACFNAAPAEAAETSLLACCGSRRWAQRLAAHRPYPTLDALLAAADEAGYDLSGADLDEALADEAAPALPPGTPTAAHTALRAAHDVYQSRFGHAFVVCLAGHHPEEHLDVVLGGIRSRLGNEPEEERAVAADELRRLARARLARLLSITNHQKRGQSGPDPRIR